MFIVRLISSLLEAQFSGWDGCLVCSGKSFFAVTAAYATEGYYMQADILEQIFFNGMGNWAILAYTCAAVAGLVGVAIGMPPKRYLWFFIGPAIYHWLVANPYQSFGTQWVAGLENRDQSMVWKLAKVGLDTSNYGSRYGIITTPDQGPSYPAEVSDFFAWYDSVISDTVVQLVEWTGATEIEGAFRIGNIGGADLISGMKWRMLEDVVNVRIRNPNLRNATGWFFGGNCGKLLMSDMIDPQRFSEAAHATGQVSTNFSFFSQSTPLGVPLPPDRDRVVGALRSQETSPYFINDIENNSSDGYLVDSGIWATLGATVYDRTKGINCADYFNVIMHGFRYEASQAIKMMYASLPPELFGADPLQILDFMFLGWDLEMPFFGNDIDTPEEAEEFLINLALVHLFKNEVKLATAKFLPDLGRSASAELIGFAETSASKITQRSKFAEVYNWALMIPQFQGFLLYLLAMVYPFACMLMLIPGWHKALFTWMSFWLWVKLWDVGFAIVMTLERSIWASLGNSADAKLVNSVVERMMGLNEYVAIPATIISQRNFTMAPYLQLANGNTDMVELFDRALYLVFNTDYELANAYYIFIMAALYMAVPAVLGQLVLMGKNGIANAFTSAVSNIGEASSKRAGDMSTDQWKRAGDEQRELANMAQMSESLGGKGSLYAKALNAEADAAQAGWDRSIADAKGNALSKISNLLGSDNQLKQQAKDLAVAEQHQGMNLFESGGPLSKVGSGVSQLFNGVGQAANAVTGGAAGRLIAAATGDGAAPGGGGDAQGAQVPAPRTGAALNAGSRDMPDLSRANARDAMGRIGGGLWDMYKASIGPSSQAAGIALSEALLNKQADISAMQQGLSNTQLLSGFESDTGRTHAGRMQKGADLSMNLDAWKSRQAFGNGASSDIIGWGALAGSYSAGSIGADSMGMAMMGMVSGPEGDKVAAAANFFDTSSAGTGANSMFSSMQGMTGAGRELAPDTVRSTLGSTPSSAWAHTFVTVAHAAHLKDNAKRGLGAQLSDAGQALSSHFGQGKQNWEKLDDRITNLYGDK